MLGPRAWPGAWEVEGGGAAKEGRSGGGEMSRYNSKTKNGGIRLKERDNGTQEGKTKVDRTDGTEI